MPIAASRWHRARRRPASRAACAAGFGLCRAARRCGRGRRVINNIQRSASLFLVKNIFSFLLSIVALALPLAYPFQPLQLSLVTFATIGAPAFFLALEPNHELVHGKFMRNVLRKALPGGLTDFLLVFCAQGFGYAFDIPSDMVGTICTLVILCVGLQILWGVCIPFTPLHWAIWGSMTVAGVGGCSAGALAAAGAAGSGRHAGAGRSAGPERPDSGRAYLYGRAAARHGQRLEK